MHTVKGYFKSLEAQTEDPVQGLEATDGLGHLHTFNFGRSVGRIEQAHDNFFLRIRWLLLGAALGLAFAAMCLQIWLSERILQFTR
jgi:hypothetical protein